MRIEGQQRGGLTIQPGATQLRSYSAKAVHPSQETGQEAKGDKGGEILGTRSLIGARFFRCRLLKKSVKEAPP